MIENLSWADATDVELIRIMLRRLDSRRLALVVSTGADLPDALVEPLEAFARRVEAVPGGSRQESAPDASAYVRGDCTSDRDDLRRAYEALPAAERAALHDARADELEARGGASLRLGAIPFHREHGSDPRGAGVAALMHAIEHCVLFGFYDAVLDIGRRCHALLDCDTDPERCWLATAKVTTALTALGRPDEVAEHYEQACARTALCFEHGAVQQAIDHLTRALGVVGDDPLLLANRAKAFERAGEPSRAIDDYAAAGAYDRASHL